MPNTLSHNLFFFKAADHYFPFQSLNVQPESLSVLMRENTADVILNIKPFKISFHALEAFQVCS